MEQSGPIRKHGGGLHLHWLTEAELARITPHTPYHLRPPIVLSSASCCVIASLVERDFDVLVHECRGKVFGDLGYWFTLIPYNHWLASHMIIWAETWWTLILRRPLSQAVTRDGYHLSITRLLRICVA